VVIDRYTYTQSLSWLFPQTFRYQRFHSIYMYRTFRRPTIVKILWTMLVRVFALQLSLWYWRLSDISWTKTQSLTPAMYSKSSLTLKEWRFNLSFPLVSMLFLNSWGVSVVPYYVTTHSPAIQKQHWHSREAKIEPPLYECEWAFIMSEHDYITMWLAAGIVI
jgi:hypothetical protein